MPLLDDKTRQDVTSMLEKISGPVKLIVFTQEFECQYCSETREIVEEIAPLSEQIDAVVYDFVKDKEQADALNIDKIPAIAILGENDVDYGIRYYGIPSGYEFSSLLHDILAVASGPQGLSLDDTTRAYLDALEEEVHLQVFVTPTCPYCPQAVVLAHAMAIASDKVRADMVEATEFPHLSNKYQVMGVPRTVINETGSLEGAAPEHMLIETLKEALAGA